jgi:very-short-patch-repair endonuclease
MSVQIFSEHPKAKYWIHEKNNVDLNSIRVKDRCKYWFNCIDCGHDFDIAINKIVYRNQWCSFCVNKRLCIDNNCKICFDKSFASHPMAIYWSDKNINNDGNKLTPRMITNKTHNKYYFNCPCGHEIYKGINNVKKNKLGCEYCGKNMTLCDNENCKFCFDKSFASVLQSKYWGKNNDKTPRQVPKGSEFKFFFDCQCGHTFKKELYGFKQVKPEFTGCEYCSRKELCDAKDCKVCFEKSFASHKDVDCFSYKNIVKPRSLFKSANYKFIFNCKKCKKEYTTSLNHFTGRGDRCPLCKNKTENKLFDALIIYYKDIKYQVRYDWCRHETNKKHFPFDFVIEDYKVIIELDGRQHFKQVRNWSPPDKQQIQDKLKMTKANENSYSVIRILQEDVFNNKYDWLEELKNTIEKIKADGKVANVYLCKNNEYECYQT